MLSPNRGVAYLLFAALPQNIGRAARRAGEFIIGGDGVSYGMAPPQGTWKERFLSEIAGAPGLERVHFLGRLPYRDYVTLMQISRAHA